MTHSSEPKKKILIMDDNVEISSNLKDHLECHDYEVMLAHDGHAGLKMITSFHPQLILLDLDMPKLKGAGVLAILRDAKLDPPIPVIVISGRSNMDGVYSDLTAGFFSKPVTMAQLLPKIETVLAVKKILPTAVNEAPSKDDAVLNQKDPVAQKDSLAIPVKGKKVLFVEDEKNYLSRLLTLFGEAGYKTESAQSHHEVIEKVILFRPQLIFVTQSLSDESGEAVVHELKRMSKTQKIPMVLYAKPGDRKFEQSTREAVLSEDYKAMGVVEIVETKDPNDLLKIAKQLI